jgi:hypothetical protein
MVKETITRKIATPVPNDFQVRKAEARLNALVEKRCIQTGETEAQAMNYVLDTPDGRQAYAKMHAEQHAATAPRINKAAEDRLAKMADEYARTHKITVAKAYAELLRHNPAARAAYRERELGA